MPEKIDLHIHTNYSDCKETPEAVFKMASENSVTALAITDHDMLYGIEEFKQLGKKYGVRYIPGMEISTTDYANKSNCHIVALNIETCTKKLQTMLNSTNEQRRIRGLQYLEKVQKMGYNITNEDFVGNSGINAIFNLQLMYALVQKGYTKETHGELYKEIYKTKDENIKEMEYPCHIEVIKEIRASGGIPVLAHPTQFNNLIGIKDMVDAGLMAIEASYPSLTQTAQTEIETLIKHYNLAASGGSDYHGGFLGNECVGSHYIESWDLC